MAIGQTRKFSLTELVAKTKKELELVKILTEADRKRIGNIVIEQIRERTRSGIGVDESGKEYKLSTKPYTTKYAKEKGVNRTSVDLTLSGDMLENMFVKNTDEKKIEISVRNRDYGKLRGAEEGIIRNKVTGKGKEIIRRPFFRLSRNDIEAIQDSGELQRTLERANKRLMAKIEKT